MSGLQARISRCLRVSGNIKIGIRLYSRKGLRILPPKQVTYIISVVFCSLIPLVVSASLNSQYNWVSPWSDYNLCTYIASVQELATGCNKHRSEILRQVCEDEVCFGKRGVNRFGYKKLLSFYFILMTNLSWYPFLRLLDHNLPLSPLEVTMEQDWNV